MFNALTDRKVEAYAVGGILVLPGILILKKMAGAKGPFVTSPSAAFE